MSISVVLPTLNRNDYAVNTVNQLIEQTGVDFEILIVDQSDNPSQELMQIQIRHPKVRYFHVNFKGLPIARNFGWIFAKHDVVLYLDDDIKCHDGLLSEHMRFMRDGHCGILAGGIDEANKIEDPQPKKVGHFNFWTATPTRGFQSQMSQPVQHAPGGNFSVQKSVFHKVGGFDEGLCDGAALYEETDFCLRAGRAGFKILFNPKARITHLAAATGGCRVPQLNKYLFNMSRNRTIIIRRYLSPIQHAPAFLRLILLNVSYTVRQINPVAFLKGLSGIFNGLSAAKKPIKCSHFEEVGR